MTQQKMVEIWNKKFGAGTPVQVEKREKFEGRTLGPAQIKNGEAVVYVDSMCGPVPLQWCRPIGKGEERES